MSCRCRIAQCRAVVVAVHGVVYVMHLCVLIVGKTHQVPVISNIEDIEKMVTELEQFLDHHPTNTLNGDLKTARRALSGFFKLTPSDRGSTIGSIHDAVNTLHSSGAAVAARYLSAMWPELGALQPDDIVLGQPKVLMTPKENQCGRNFFLFYCVLD